jgi:hypothetical protein
MPERDRKPSVDERPGDQPFPPAWFARLLAITCSVIVPVALVLCWGSWENRSDKTQQALTIAAWLFLGALVTAWLTDVWTRQGHLMHATAAFVVTLGLLGAGAIVSVPHF